VWHKFSFKSLGIRQLKQQEKVKVLFVCMGNICRSPTAEGVFSKIVADQGKALLDKFVIDSAGTHAYHTNEAPDLRAQSAAQERGVKLSHIRARKVVMGDFEDFDYLLAMDQDNYSTLIQACPEPFRQKIKYFLDYAPHFDTREVPDPYYGGAYGFERVLDLVEEAAEGFLNELQKAGEI
jgi:protein-tyrosine phosphatase